MLKGSNYLLEGFFKSEKAGGLILIGCAIISLALTNSPLNEVYLRFWNTEFSDHNIVHWVNDGLMAIFFLLIGLELEREVYIGELSTVKKALLPAIAAMGGMIVPAGIHLILNYGTPSQSGAGIPMATDIAFALAVLSLLGNRVPISLKIFLTALAVIDDLGAILVIAIFYTGTVIWTNLMIAVAIFGMLFILNRLKVRRLVPYLIGGLGIWYFMLHSGIHATIAGVLTAFVIPFGNGDERSASFVLQRFLHKPVAFLILPLFALANTAVKIPDTWFNDLFEVNSLGIFLGLLAGKPIGIFAFSYVAVKAKIARLPADLNWSNVFGIGFLGGIGFTMSVFITLLAFQTPQFIDESKIVILLSSLVAGVCGFTLLHRSFSRR